MTQSMAQQTWTFFPSRSPEKLTKKVFPIWCKFVNQECGKLYTYFFSSCLFVFFTCIFFEAIQNYRTKTNYEINKRKKSSIFSLILLSTHLSNKIDFLKWSATSNPSYLCFSLQNIRWNALEWRFQFGSCYCLQATIIFWRAKVKGDNLWKVTF